MQLTKFRSEDSIAAEINKNLASREIYYLMCVVMQLRNVPSTLGQSKLDIFDQARNSKNLRCLFHMATEQKQNFIMRLKA